MTVIKLLLLLLLLVEMVVGDGRVFTLPILLIHSRQRVVVGWQAAEMMAVVMVLLLLLLLVEVGVVQGTLGYPFDPSIRWHMVVSRFHLIDRFQIGWRNPFLWAPDHLVFWTWSRTTYIPGLLVLEHIFCSWFIPQDGPGHSFIPHWNCLFGQITYLPIWVIPLHVFNIGCVIHVQDPFFDVNSTVMSIW